jgi:hypothetical protein
VPSRDDDAKVEDAKRDLEYDHSSCVQRKGYQNVLGFSLAACSCRHHNNLVTICIVGKHQGDDMYGLSDNVPMRHPI